MTSQKITGWRNRPPIKPESFASDRAFNGRNDVMAKKMAVVVMRAGLAAVPSNDSINTDTRTKEKPASGVFSSI